MFCLWFQNFNFNNYMEVATFFLFLFVWSLEARVEICLEKEEIKIS